MFTRPSGAYRSGTSESVVDRDADRLDQDYIDTISVDYVQDEDADPEGEMYDSDDCDEIPSGVKITVSLV